MSSSLHITQYGDWVRAQKILHENLAPVRKALGKAWRKEARRLKKEVVKGIQAQAPGGKQFKPLASTTLAIRRFLGFRGTKALMWQRNLLRGVKVTAIGRAGSWGYMVFVGIHRDARSPQGKSLYMIGMLAELGSRPIIIKVTPRMLRFLGAAFASLRKNDGGVDKPWYAIRGKGKGVIVIRIPARPVFQPIWDIEARESAKRVIADVQSDLAAAWFVGRAP